MVQAVANGNGNFALADAPWPWYYYRRAPRPGRRVPSGSGPARAAGTAVRANYFEHQVEAERRGCRGEGGKDGCR